MQANLNFQSITPDKSLADFVHYFWQLTNATSNEQIVTILPDGYFDILFSLVNNRPIQQSLVGLMTKPIEYSIPINATTFAISFKLPAAEYLVKTPISDLVNKSRFLPPDFWELDDTDFADFTCFVTRATEKMKALINKAIDPRKQALFDLLHTTHGTLPIQEMSAAIHWSSRQINRYFARQFGISLKAYCTILRYRASFGHLKAGILYPQENYTDQAHFIKEIKKYSGATPKQLATNKKDRFIQLSTLPKP